MKKLVVVINGSGGVGKDTLISFLEKKYKIMNVSSVDPIKDIARYAGWDGNKSDKSRKMLSSLKSVFTEFCDMGMAYVVDSLPKFDDSDAEVMFVHIREPKEIARFVAVDPSKIKTLLIRRSTIDEHSFGNPSDDDVEMYDYDRVFDNKMSLSEAEIAFTSFFDRMFDEYAYSIDF